MEIDLELVEGSVAGRRCTLGQVTVGGSGVEGGRAVADGPAGRVAAEVDDLGQFVLDGLSPGPHRLEITLPHAVIEIRALPV